jgi:hypothetical protein
MANLEQINAARVIVDTLAQADNEATAAPYWLIIDPAQNMRCDIHAAALQITGPFFCRQDAANHLEARNYAFSSRARVYCASGYWSQKYKDLCRTMDQV